MLIKSFLAFGAGFISFLSPCVLPLIPGYISYISGESLGDIVEKQKKIILKTVLFSLGFSLVFISFGATASFIKKKDFRQKTIQITYFFQFLWVQLLALVGHHVLDLCLDQS